MRTVLVLATTIAVLALSGCSGRAIVKEAVCAISDGSFRADESFKLHGSLFVDQHGDFIRPVNCPAHSVRVYGIRTADGAAADALRKDIDNTLTLFNVYWTIDATVRTERDKDGPIFRILSVRSFKRLDARPNNSFKPKPLRGSA